MVAARVRTPAQVVGDGGHTIAELVLEVSLVREAATAGASMIPLDELTQGGGGGRRLPAAPFHDVTDDLHPALAAAAVGVVRAMGIPVVGVDLVIDGVNSPGQVVIEANEQPGLANHEPRPTASRFVDLLFPATASPVV